MLTDLVQDPQPQTTPPEGSGAAVPPGPDGTARAVAPEPEGAAPGMPPRPADATGGVAAKPEETARAGTARPGDATRAEAPRPEETAGAGPPLLDVTDLAVRFGPVQAVDGVSLRLTAGPFGLGLVGESGSASPP